MSLTLVQAFGLVSEGGQDLIEFESGQETALPNVWIGGKPFTVSAQKFGETQPGAPFVILSGGVFGFLAGGFALYEQAATGAATSLAEKFGNTWYGITLAPVVPGAGQ